MPLLTWLVWAVLAGIAGLAVFLSARAALLGTRKALALAVLAGAAAISGLALLRAQPSSRQLAIEITSPATASRVEGHQVWISGTVDPTDAQVAVAVRAEGSDLWWLQETVRPQADGRWSIAAYLGEPEVGRGEDFQVVALASTDPPWLDLLKGRRPTPGTTTPSLPLWSRSEAIVLTRER